MSHEGRQIRPPVSRHLVFPAPEAPPAVFARAPILLVLAEDLRRHGHSFVREWTTDHS